MNNLTINSDEIAQALRPKRRPLPVTDCSDARIKTLKWQFLDVARAVCPGFRVADYQKESINAIFRWCLRLDGPLDVTKGLWIHGSIGSGKSTMLEIVRQFCAIVRPKPPYSNYYWFPIYSAIDICDDYERNGAEAFGRYTAPRLAIDDLGAEPRLMGHYGNMANVLQQVLLRRYNLRLDNPEDYAETNVTTNFTKEQIAEVYGERVYDRCEEMFNFIELSGYSWRQ